MIERELVAFLSSDTTVQSLVGETDRTRIFPHVIPQKDRVNKQVPCIVYAVISEDRQKTYCGTSKLVSVGVQLDMYAISLLAARDLSNAVRAAMVDFRGLMGGVVVRDVTLTSGLTLYDMEPGLMRVVDTYTIWCEQE